MLHNHRDKSADLKAAAVGDVKYDRCRVGLFVIHSRHGPELLLACKKGLGIERVKEKIKS